MGRKPKGYGAYLTQAKKKVNKGQKTLYSPKNCGCDRKN